MTKLKKYLCLLLSTLLLLSAGCARANDPGADGDFPTPEELVRELSSDVYQGRAVGSAGNGAAGVRLSDLMRQLKLEPFFDDYLQPYDEDLALPEATQPAVALVAADGGRTVLTPGVDYTCSLPVQAIKGTYPISADGAACEDGSCFYYADQSAVSEFLMQHTERLGIFCEEVKTASTCNNGRNRTDTGFLLLLDESRRALLEQTGMRLELSVQPGTRQGKANNVVAVLRGSEGKNALVIGAHYDGSGFCGELLYPSAYDNASGTAAVAETARLLTQKSAALKNDIIFAFFNGEESGMDGSAALAQALLDKYTSVNLVNIDCVGHRSAAGVGVYDEDGSNQSLQQALMACGKGYLAKVVYSSDHRSFDRAGIPAVSVADADVTARPLHTPLDTADQVSGEAVAAVAAAVADFAGSDTLYAAQQLQSGTDFMTGLPIEVLKQQQALTADGTITKVGQAYVYGKDGDHFTAVTGSNKLLFSLAEAAEAAPSFLLPETLGDGAFQYANACYALPDKSPFTQGNCWLRGDYQVGQLYDFTGQLSVLQATAVYRNDSGFGLIVTIDSGDQMPENNKEDGSLLSPSLAGYSLYHEVYPEFGIDGYSGIGYRMDNGVRILCYFSDLSGWTRPDDPWAAGQPNGPTVRLSGDDLIALADKLDLPALAAILN